MKLAARRATGLGLPVSYEILDQAFADICNYVKGVHQIDDYTGELAMSPTALANRLEKD